MSRTRPRGSDLDPPPDLGPIPDPGDGYPTPWQFATHAGCNPKCKQRARRVEVRYDAARRPRKRHVYTLIEIMDAILREGYTFRVGRVGGGATIYALSPREADGTLQYPTKAKAFGNSERQAVQNLADALRVPYGQRCPR